MEKYHFISEQHVTDSRAGMLHQYVDSWWVVHPEKGLAFWDKGYSHPQCNRDETLSRRLCPDWGVVKFFERVLVPLNLADYRE